MPKLKNQPPRLCRIKATNTAVVYVNGRRIVLGPYGSEKALQEYARFLTEWTNAEIKETVRVEKKTPTVAKLTATFLKWAETNVGGSRFGHYKVVSKALLKFYRSTLISDFGPLALAAVQAEFVQNGYSRGHCNNLVGYARQMFNWGVSREMVPESVSEDDDPNKNEYDYHDRRK